MSSIPFGRTFESAIETAKWTVGQDPDVYGQDYVLRDESGKLLSTNRTRPEAVMCGLRIAAERRIAVQIVAR